MIFSCKLLIFSQSTIFPSKKIFKFTAKFITAIHAKCKILALNCFKIQYDIIITIESCVTKFRNFFHISIYNISTSVRALLNCMWEETIWFCISLWAIWRGVKSCTVHTDKNRETTLGLRIGRSVIEIPIKSIEQLTIKRASAGTFTLHERAWYLSVWSYTRRCSAQLAPALISLVKSNRLEILSKLIQIT